MLWVWKFVEKLETCLADTGAHKKSGSRAAALHTNSLWRLAEDICVQEVVAELALGVELFGQGYEFGELFVMRVELLGRHGEELAPVGSRLKRGEFFFDHRQELAGRRASLVSR